MKKINFLLIVLIMIIIVFFSGCIETGSDVTTYGSSFANVTITEHTYFFGEEGFFTKIYDINETLMGITINELKTLNLTQVSEIKNKYLN